MGNTVTLGDRAEGIRCFDPSHVSYSGAGKWDECEWQAHAIRDLGIKDWMGPEACVGSAVDEAVGLAMNGADPSSIDVPALLAEAIRDMANPEVAAGWKLDQEREKAQALFDLWVREVQPTLPPVWATQLELHFVVPGTEVTAHVHLDTVFEDGAIDDTKTSKNRLKDHQAAESVQLTWYAGGLREVYGQPPGRVSLTGLIYANPPQDVLQSRELAGLPKPTKPWLDRQWSTRTDEQIDALFDEIARREEARRWAIKTGIYQTNGRTDFFACGRCAARPICPSWTGYANPKELNVIRSVEGAA